MPSLQGHFLAAEQGDENEITRLLVEYPLVIMEKDSHGRTALHYASEKGHDKLVEKMIAYNPKLIDITSNGLSALHCAAREGHDSVVAKLLEHQPKLSTTSTGLTALHFAARRGHDKIVAMLLEYNPELADQGSWDGMTALHCAAEDGQEKAVEQLLAHCPTASSAADSTGLTALHFAAKRGHDNVAAMLLTQRPQLIDAVDFRRRTALHWALRNGRETVAELLLSCKPEHAHCSLDGEGNTLLHLATDRSIYNQFCSQAFIEHVWKLNTGALFALNREARTPLHVAVTCENRVAVELLQWQMTVEELVMIFSDCKRPLWIRPAIEQQCEPLATALHRDILQIVDGYVGLDAATPNLKRKIETPPHTTQQDSAKDNKLEKQNNGKDKKRGRKKRG